MGFATNMRVGVLFILFIPFVLVAAEPGVQILNRERLHLRSGDAPAWGEFEKDPAQGRRWDVDFLAKANVTETTLLIRQDDVRQEWSVEINGRRLGKLFLMESDLVQTIPVPAGALREGANRLSIIPRGENDDIVLHEISLVSAPVHAAIH